VVTTIGTYSWPLVTQIDLSKLKRFIYHAMYFISMCKYRAIWKLQKTHNTVNYAQPCLMQGYIQLQYYIM